MHLTRRMRWALATAFVFVMTSAIYAADRPQPPASFAPVADMVKAAVYSVVVPDEEIDDDGDGEDGLTTRELLQQLFEALAGHPNRMLGAAVMLDPAGIAVTGSRILQGFTDVEVVALDGAHYKATVLGRDDRSDLAVLRVAAPGPLPAARLGNSDEVRVGDWVLAVGSPYGFEASVSAGIVSARTRVAAGGAYGELLQTDAAIDPGSAGGPLVNTRGEVVGLTSTATPRGVGIGFVAPSNLVRKVVDDIVAHGRVVRGWLGIAPQPLTAELARAFRTPLRVGLLLADVAPGGPAAAAGLTRGTILVALDGRPLGKLSDLDDVLAVARPGQAVALDLWRNGRQETMRMVLGREPPPAASRNLTHRLRGLVVEGVTPEVGVVIAAVAPGSPADRAGARRGDVVREVNRRLTRGLADFDEASTGIEPGQSIPLLVQRDWRPFYLVLVPDR